EADLALLMAALEGAYDARCDFDGSGTIDLVDLALFARQLRIGIASDEFHDFTVDFVDYSVNGGFALPARRGMVLTATPGSDLLVYPSPYALLVRSNEAGDPASEGVLTSRPFVPGGPLLTMWVISESRDVVASVRLLRPTRTPRAPAPEDVLLEAPLRNDRPGVSPAAGFLPQVLDISRWFNAEHPPLAPGGEAVHLPTRRGQGLVAVPGIALTGERSFEPGTTLYRFAVRGRQPGTTALEVEALTVVDRGDALRILPVAPAAVTVRA